VDFPLVLKKVLSAFQEHQIRYALIGGFAMGLWGLPRATVDLDFLVAVEDMPQVHAIMKTLGYSRRYHSDNVSQYASDLRFWGTVDFLHAFRKASLGMLKRAVIKELYGRTIEIKVATIEDLIGLKIQALTNDPTRRSSDLADIETLLDLHNSHLDWDLLEGYFQLFEQTDVLRRLKEKYGCP
jgi:predicted nucleotidyltransferase